MRDPLNDSESGLDVEASGGPDGPAPDMRSGFLASCDHRLDQISGLKSEVSLLPGQISPGESESVEPGPLAGSPAGGLDCQKRAFPAGDAIHLPDARRVEGMLLGDS